VNRPTGLNIASCKRLEDDALVVGQMLADDGDQENAPRGPAIVGKQRAEVPRVRESLAH
jgi:hypothetical protein